ncbi:hypothetical protein A2W24_04060 [Microgenomates group bacterium RBG_16_45_19]|nr:MAG: hypothetical protein A2W24_04060 [Microgenomates group bacterium RBG_16_45_19]
MKHVVLTLILSSFITVIFLTIPKAVLSQAAPNYSLNPATSSNPSSLQLRINTGTNTVTSMEIAIDVTGTDILNADAITPILPSGMSAITDEVVNIPGGKQIQLIIMGGAGTGTINTNGSNVAIGTINFTAPVSGQTTFTLNSMSTMYAGTSGNVLASFFTESYTFAATPSNTPVPPTNTPVPPTNTPVPTNDGVIIINFRLQGITTSVPAQDITFTLKDSSTNVNLLPPIVVNGLAPSGAGIYSTSLTNLPRQTVKVCIKSQSHLQRCTVDSSPIAERARHVNLATNPNTNLDMVTHSSNQLIVGDLNNDNQINSWDSGRLGAAYNAFIAPVPTDCGQCDVNLDGQITIDDYALVLMNYTSIAVPGDDYE